MAFALSLLGFKRSGTDQISLKKIGVILSFFIEAYILFGFLFSLKMFIIFKIELILEKTWNYRLRNYFLKIKFKLKKTGGSFYVDEVDVD